MNVLFPFEFNISVGGAQRCITEIIRYDHLNNKFFALLPIDGDYGIELNKYGVKVYYAVKSNYWEFTIRNIPVSIYHMILVTRELNRIISDENIDIVHTNMDQSLICACLCKILGRQKFKLIWHNRSTKLNWKNMLLVKVFNRQIDQILTTTEYLKNLMVNKGIKPERIKVIYDSTDFCLDNDYVKNNIDREHVNITLIARICRIKGHKEFIEIASNLIKRSKRKLKFDIVGVAEMDDDKKYLNEVRKLVVEYELQEYINFTGTINDINSYMKGVDILFCTTVYPGESFGRVIVEAFSNKVPVIALNYGSVGEIIDNNINGFLANSIDEFTQHALNLIEDLELRRNMGESGFAKTIKKFNGAINNRQINELYYKI